MDTMTNTDRFMLAPLGYEQEFPAEFQRSDSQLKVGYYGTSGKHFLILTYFDETGRGFLREHLLIDNGLVIAQGRLNAQGEYEGPYKSYYCKNGSLENIGTINSAGKFEGPYESYFCASLADGSELREQSIRNSEGKFEGLYISYWPGGYLNEKGIKHPDGRFEGPYESYYANGQLSVKGTYNPKGYFEGAYEKYHRNGQLQEKGIQNGKGKFVGPYEKYWENGRIAEKSNYDAEGNYTDETGKPVYKPTPVLVPDSAVARQSLIQRGRAKQQRVIAGNLIP